MYIRFIGTGSDERIGTKEGIFTIAYQLLHDNQLYDYEEVELRQLLNWFKKHLPIPTNFSRKKNHSDKQSQGISWVKEEATEAMTKLWELKTFINSKDLIIEVIRTTKPGYIVYEDDFQVVAEPFRREKPNSL